MDDKDIKDLFDSLSELEKSLIFKETYFNSLTKYFIDIPKR